MTTTLINHIEITPETCGGKPRIAGHRIKVQDVVIWHERLGMSPDEIVYHYPSISITHAGIAYCPQQSKSIGQIIRGLLLIWEILEPEEMYNHIEFI